MVKDVWIEIQTEMPLADAAFAVGRALGGLHFESDLSGHYEEYPAFIAQSGSRKYALLGIPAPEYDVREDPDANLQLRVEDADGPNPNLAGEVLAALSSEPAFVCEALE